MQKAPSWSAANTSGNGRSCNLPTPSLGVTSTGPLPKPQEPCVTLLEPVTIYQTPDGWEAGDQVVRKFTPSQSAPSPFLFLCPDLCASYASHRPSPVEPKPNPGHWDADSFRNTDHVNQTILS